ncbi:MAG: peptidylprolyl isomerase [Anaerolineales bacterium]
MLRRWLAILLLPLAACSQTEPITLPAPPTSLPLATTPAIAVPIPGTPTPTAEPLAARVNDQPISLAVYQAEMQRCESANAFPDCAARVLQSLIEQASVEQAAVAAGLVVSDEEVQAEIANVQTGQGSAEAYAAWLAANGYTEDSFREALRRDLLRARMAAKVTEPVGETAEQVHALVILVADEATARSLLDQLRAGADFATLAVNNSLDLSTRVAGGDAGWVPRGTLTQPEVEQAAFALQPGETSEVIQAELGYYLIRVLERDPARTLSPAARQTLLIRAYEVWLSNVLAQSRIERLVNP